MSHSLGNGLALLVPWEVGGRAQGVPAPWISVPEVGPGARELKATGEVRQEGNVGCEQAG